MECELSFTDKEGNSSVALNRCIFIAKPVYGSASSSNLSRWIHT